MNRFAITSLILAATLGLSRWSERRVPDTLAQPLPAIPGRLGGWVAGADGTLDERVLSVLKPTSYLSREYSSQGNGVGLFIAYYAHQRSGESMHSPKNCLPGAGWEVWDYGTVTVDLAGRKVGINKYSVQNGASRMVVLYWYQSRKRIVASEYLGKIFLVRDALLDGVTSGSIVRLTLPDRPGAVEDGLAFASLLIPEVQRCLGRDG